MGGPGHIQFEEPTPPPTPPIRPCVHCGRGFYTWMRPAVCLDCRVPVRRPDPDPGPGDVLAVLGALFGSSGGTMVGQWRT